MPRQSYRELGSQAVGAQLFSRALDPSIGGQQGWAPDFTTIQNNQAYVSRPLVAVLLEAPKWFNYMGDNPQKYYEILRAFIETRSVSIEGIRLGYTMEYVDHEVGRSGEVQHEPSNSKIEVCEPNHTVVEVEGLVYENFFRMWIQYGLKDPQTGYALASLLQPDGQDEPWGMDKTSATVLYFEPDPGFRYVRRAVICTNMMPRSNGEQSIKRVQTAGEEIVRLSITFTALTQRGIGPTQTAQRFLDAMRRQNADPYLTPSFIQNVEADVAAAAGSSFQSTVGRVADSAIPTPVR